MPTKHVRVSRPGSNPVRESDLRIQKAIESLESTERGKAVLKDLAVLFHGQASGLDLSGMANLVCLVREFAMGSRRGFLPDPPRSTPQFIILNGVVGNKYVAGFDRSVPCVVLTDDIKHATIFTQWQAECFVDDYSNVGYGLVNAVIEQLK